MVEMNNYDFLWVQKYAPKALNDIVLSEENRDFFSQINEDVSRQFCYYKKIGSSLTAAQHTECLCKFISISTPGL